jgi:hypothetical protein
MATSPLKFDWFAFAIVVIVFAIAILFGFGAFFYNYYLDNQSL